MTNSDKEAKVQAEIANELERLDRSHAWYPGLSSPALQDAARILRAIEDSPAIVTKEAPKAVESPQSEPVSFPCEVCGAGNESGLSRYRHMKKEHKEVSVGKEKG